MSMTIMKVPVSFVLLVLIRVGSGSDTNVSTVGGAIGCDLDCHQNSTCVFGNADFSNHPVGPDGKPLTIHLETNNDGMHCACPNGYTGLRCNRIFESCDADHKCYNGGKCIPGLQDFYGNEQLFCDCSNAVNENGDPMIGKFCEHAQIDACELSGSFCVNGGDCNPLFPAEPRGGPCTCPEGYEGIHCEFKIGSVPNCDLDCKNGGSCTLGLVNPPQFHDLAHLYNNTHNLMHCTCPRGYGGSLCQNEKNNCGSHHCYHGGICVSREAADGTIRYHCDCTTANEDDSRYAGRFCQFQSTSICTEAPDQNGQLFCVNGGTCEDNAIDGCQCPDGFTGDSCEFQTLPILPTPAPAEPTKNVTDPVPPPVPEPCSLTCENGGKCRRGSKDLSILASAALAKGLNVSYNENFEHCICPDGFVGLTCEHRIEICDEGFHVCLHGSKCVKFGDESSCDCQEAETDFASHFAGASCEHQSTSLCTKGPLLPGRPRSFCVNDGICRTHVDSGEPHPGCRCNSQWTGPHCELPVKKAPSPAPTSAETSITGLGMTHTLILYGAVMLTIILVAASCVCIVMYRREKIAKARREAQAAQLNTYTMPSVKYSDNPRGTMQQESAPDGFDDEQAPFVTGGGGGGGGGSYRDGSRSDLSGVNVL